MKRSALAACTTLEEGHSYGPAPHNSWRVDEGTVSLVRQGKPPMPVRFHALPQRIELDVTRSALLVVDMQNDFCHPEGWFGQKGIDLAPMRAPIPAITAFLPTWRAAGGTVVWLHWGIRADRLNLSPTIHFKGKRTPDGVGYGEHSPVDHGPALVQGAWGAERIGELPAADGDITIHKHRLSGFWDNELDSVLRQLGVTTLLFAGINTDRCVFSTLQDGNFLGYDCVLLADACGTPSPGYVTEAIHFLVQQLHGFVAQAADLQAQLVDAQPLHFSEPPISLHEESR